MQGRLFGFLIVLLLSAAAMGASLSFEWEGRVRDLTFRWLSVQVPVPAQDQVVVVGFDEEDLRQFSVPLALMHRPLGTFLEAAALGGARAIGLDIGLPEVSFDALVPGLDAALARGILIARSSSSLVFGLGVNQGGAVQVLHPAFEVLLGADRLAILAVLPDRDGVIRRFDERLGSDGARMPTLAGRMARVAGVEVTDGLMHYAHGSPWKTIAMRQVIEWHDRGDRQALAQVFKGRFVILGSRLAFDDQHRTPLSLSGDPDFAGTSHGVLLHAQQLRNLLEGRIVRPLSTGLLWVGLLVFAIPWWWAPGWRTSTLGAALGFGLVVASVVLLRAGMAIPLLSWLLTLALSLSCRAAWAGWLASRERARLRASFSGMVSPAVLEEIVSGRLDTQSSGARRDVCVLFSDIRGFTSISEVMGPEEVTALLNRYFERMSGIIHEHRGMVDKFIGDGIMAVFGAPQGSANPCQDAFDAGCKMLEQLRVFNEEQRMMRADPIRIGIGLHFGPAVLGYVGSPQRFEYSAIGDTVNTASRIESLTKEAGYGLLMSAEVSSLLRDTSQLTPLGTMPIRGRSALDIMAWSPSKVS